MIKSELNVQRSDISKKKTRDKIAQLIKNFKNVRRLAKNTDWGVDITKHDVVANNTREATIKEMIIKKCSHYYEFEEIMRDMSIINSSFVMKFIRPDREETKEENILSENYEAWIVPNDTTVSNEIVSNEIAPNEIVANDEVNDVDVFDYASNDDSNFSFSDVIISLSEKTSLPEKISLSDKDRFKDIIKKVRRSTDKIKTKEKRSLMKRHLDDSDSNVSKKTQKTKFISFADSLVQVQFMKSKDFVKQFEIDRALSQQRFATKMKQRDQHHEEMILRHQETICHEMWLLIILRVRKPCINDGTIAKIMIIREEFYSKDVMWSVLRYNTCSDH